MQPLQGDEPAEPFLPGLVDHPHAALRDGAEDVIARQARPVVGGQQVHAGFLDRALSPGGGAWRLAKGRQQGIGGRVEPLGQSLARRAAFEVFRDGIDVALRQAPLVEREQVFRGWAGAGHARSW
jgi:hypothetical protein